MIAVIDYGAGNLFSLLNALHFIGLECLITCEKQEIDRCNSIILPGVGAFPNAKNMLERAGLTDFLKQQARKKPFLGICVGAQLMLDRGYEHVETEGLSIVSGHVRKIEAPGLKIPHVGWNSLMLGRRSKLLEGVDDGSFAYFVHSYKIETDEGSVAAYCEYGEVIPAVIQDGYAFGTQFHPEKSGRAGLLILSNFGRLA